ncbi:carboxymuconolactone decarboxylase family protein [Altererythrobacter sp. MF3-039]|uniref:carboxymuconolactone decarboxylase family protein n=1 Tax=Altererythrobacter sp. MF3-039 TaxID=3252901 RepID=UPI00390C4704
MRLDKPRIEPVDMDRLSEEQQSTLAPFADPSNMVGGGKVLNIFRTLVHAPKALSGFLAWGNYVLSRRNSLPPREREIVILRVGWLCKSGYEFAQHSRIGRDCGLSSDEIERIKAGPQAEGWTALEAAMLRACDELVADHHVSDSTWEALAELGDKGRMNLVFTVGQYTQVSMILNSFGIQIEDGDTIDPDLRV